MLKRMWKPDTKADEIQRNIYKDMTSIQKWQVVKELRTAAWHIKAAGVRHQNPDWTEEQVEEKVKEIFLYATT